MSANSDVASVLYEIGEILTVKGDIFRSRAYQMAAQRITALTEDIRAIKARGELESIPGVGKSISAVISEVLDTGQSKILEELRESLPKGVRDLMELEGVGPKLAMRLNQELGVASIDDLEKAAKEGRVRELKGFGPKKEANILVSIDAYRSRQTRFLLGAILPVVDQLTKYMRESDAVLKVEVAGSARRRKETIGDLDVLASSMKPEEVTQRFITMPPVIRVVSHGTTRSTVVLEGQIQVDLRVVAPEEYGSALQYFTGSKEHNVKLRTIGVKKGFKLNEYGLFDRDTDRRVAGEDEEGIYRALGMDLMPPELRENTGEIEAAIEHRLPKLVEEKEIRGDLHIHTKWSDGTATIEEMAEKARSMGLEYIAVTDHTKSLGIARGLDEARLREQVKEIEQLNRGLEGFTVLTGTEVDVKADGSLDLPDSVLKDLDFVIASIHSGFKSDVEKMTNRLIAAMNNEYVDAVGHPTGRIIQKRNPYELNLERVFEAAAGQKVMMEINAFPDRLDLSDVNSRAAMQAGCVMEIGTDSHAANQLDFLPLGVSVARRGWLEAEDVANTMPIEKVVNYRH
ncbi:DNA polymerase/3'-5' exonuclease PolX [Candidatus Bathyarchaeota archaeon]|jgi:DNA polymerase (family 10)|nr:DNA polymerase/3'-5' exonuclease PolX [Candidatus Bathyarchaeota archaeon]